ITYELTDHLGSVVRTTTAAGGPQLSREYDPWGKLLAGASTSGYAFTGREWDSDAALYYHRARYYDPTRGRIISEDPSGVQGGIMRYSYARNAPIRYVDSLGLKPADNYDDPDAAAIAAIKDINCHSIKVNVEYCGRVYKCSDKIHFSYTPPIPGTSAHCGPGRWPRGTENAGWYHTHAASVSPTDEEFSADDKGLDPFEPAYLGTPACRILKYDPVVAAAPNGKTDGFLIGTMTCPSEPESS